MSIKAKVIIYDDKNPKVKEKPYLLIPYDVDIQSNDELMLEHFKFRFDYERMEKLNEKKSF